MIWFFTEAMDGIEAGVLEVTFRISHPDVLCTGRPTLPTGWLKAAFAVTLSNCDRLKVPITPPLLAVVLSSEYFLAAAAKLYPPFNFAETASAVALFFKKMADRFT